MIENRRLPGGAGDQGPAECERVGYFGRRLSSLFAAWGYSFVEPPVFELYETFRVGTAAFAEERVYRFLDRDGRLLALRPEMTTGIARMVAAAVGSAADSGQVGEFGGLPFRLAYQGPVFRNEPAGSGRHRSFWQAGVEFIGEGGPDADAEVIALAAAAAGRLGFDRARVVLGHAGLACSALSAAGADLEQARRLRAVVAGRDLVGLSSLLGGAVAEIFAGGPYGPGEARAVLDRLARISRLSAGAGAVARILDAVAGYGYPDVVVDLALLRDLDYYTGAAFEILVPGLGGPLGGGGRYDRLLERFGAHLPATGFALDLSVAAARSPSVRPARRLLAVATAARSELPLALRTATALRETGCPVELIPGNCDLRGAMVAAARRGARKLLFFEHQAYREIDLAANGNDPRCAGAVSSPGSLRAARHGIH